MRFLGLGWATLDTDHHNWMPCQLYHHSKLAWNKTDTSLSDYPSNFSFFLEPNFPAMASLPPATKTLKARLYDGDTLYGLFLLSFSPTLAEISGLAGYDFVVVDVEHGHGGISQALPCLQALSATHTPTILRLPENSPSWAKKALDLGPDGLMFPMIDEPESAKNAVSYCRYPPAGIRGAAHPIVRASKYGLDDDYLEMCERELLLMCQVESEEAVNRAEEIAAVDG